MDWTALVKIALQIIPAFLPQGANSNPVVSSALAAAVAYDHDTVKWMQGALNSEFNLSPPLVVDGLWGPKTKAAVQTAAARYGLPATGTLSRALILALEAATKALPKT